MRPNIEWHSFIEWMDMQEPAVFFFQIINGRSCPVVGIIWSSPLAQA